jgi:hypothetical protein
MFFSIPATISTCLSVVIATYMLARRELGLWPMDYATRDSILFPLCLPKSDYLQQLKITILHKACGSCEISLPYDFPKR